MYNLGPNGTLILNNLTSVYQYISSLGLETYPMLSSYPHPPQFLDWMRYVFADPDPFIDACVQAYASLWAVLCSSLTHSRQHEGHGRHRPECRL